MTFPMTLTIGTTTLVVPVNDTKTKADRNLGTNYTDAEWIAFWVNEALGFNDYLYDPNHPDYIPF